MPEYSPPIIAPCPKPVKPKCYPVNPKMKGVKPPKNPAQLKSY